MPTFTRLSDDSELTPTMVFGPYEQSREVRNIVRPVMESAEVRVSYSPTVYRKGEYQLLFDTYAEAKAAVNYFSAFSLYYFEGPTIGAGELITVGGYILESDGTDLDTNFAMQFVVAPGDMTITQNGLWELRVPYQEVPEDD